jgi:hypothetical protein
MFVDQFALARGAAREHLAQGGEIVHDRLIRVGKDLSVFTWRVLHNSAKSFSERALGFITDGLGDRIQVHVLRVPNQPGRMGHSPFG